MLNIRPIVDLAAIITLFIGVSTAAVLLEQYGEIQRYEIPITLLEIPTASIVISGSMLGLLFILLLPSIYAQRRPSLRRSQRSVQMLQADIVIVLVGLFAMALVSTIRLPVIHLPPNFMFIEDSMNNSAGIVVAATPLIILFIALSPLRSVVLLWGIRRHRRNYYTSLRAQPRTRAQKIRIAHYVKGRTRIHGLQRRFRPGEIMSTTFSPSMFYVAYVAIFFLMSAYGLGLGRSESSNLIAVIKGSPMQLVLLSYSDVIITTCYDERTNAFAPGYVLRRITKDDVHVVFKARSFVAPYVQRLPNPSLPCF